MNLKKFAASILAVAMLILFSGCKEESVEEDPTITFSPEILEVPYEGGEFSVGYTIVHPVEGAAIDVSAAQDAGWLNEFNLETEGRIVFNVDRNEVAQSRETIVKVNYTGLKEAATFTVKQAEGVEVPRFEITIKDITNISAISSVIPADKEMRYIRRVSGVEYVDQFADDAELFKNDCKYFERMAEDNQVSFEDVVEGLALAGDHVDEELSVLKPGSDFYCYVYGIDVEKCERLTDIVKVRFSTLPVEMQDVKFDLSADIDAGNVTVHFNPVDYDGYYYARVLQGGNVTEDDPKLQQKLMNTMTNGWMTDFAFFYDLHYEPDFVLNECAYTGDFSETMELVAETTYLMAVVPLNDEALICSEEVTYLFFTTGKPEDSANAIQIEVTNVYDNRAHLKFIPSNDDPYAAGILPANLVDGFKDDQETLKYIIEHFSPASFNGEFESDVKPLTPETEYYVFAFGFESYQATTDLYSVRFTTTAVNDAVSDVKGYIAYGDYADAKEVGALDPKYGEFVEEGTVFIPFTTSSEPEGYKVYWNLYRQTVVEDPRITKDMLKEDAVLKGFSTPHEVFHLPYGMSLVAVAVAEDEEGNLGEIYIGEALELTSEGCMSAEEFLQLYPYPYLDRAAFAFPFYQGTKHILPVADEEGSLLDAYRIDL